MLIFEWCKCDCSSQYVALLSLAIVASWLAFSRHRIIFYANACHCVCSFVRSFICILFRTRWISLSHRLCMSVVRTHMNVYQHSEIIWACTVCGMFSRHKRTPWCACVAPCMYWIYSVKKYCVSYTERAPPEYTLFFLPRVPKSQFGSACVWILGSVQSIHVCTYYFLSKCRFYFPIEHTHTSVLCSRIPRYDSSSFIVVGHEQEKEEEQTNKTVFVFGYSDFRRIAQTHSESHTHTHKSVELHTHMHAVFIDHKQ